MRTLRAALAACVLLVVTACSTSVAQNAPRIDRQSAGTSQTTGPRTPVTHFGDKYRFHSGILVNVSEPTTFQPSDAAYPESEDAIAFEVWVRNETGHPYQLSDMAVTVTAGGVSVEQIIDPTQGYNGVTSSEKGLPKQSHEQINLAFAVPAHPGRLKVTFRPHQARPVKVIYVGSQSNG